MIQNITSLIAPWWGVKVPGGHRTSCSTPAGQYLPRAQGNPGPDEPIRSTYFMRRLAQRTESKLILSNQSLHSSLFCFFGFWFLWYSCIKSAKTCLQDRTILLYISYRLPYLSDPVVPLLYQPGKVTHEVWRCPLHRKIPVGTGTGSWVSVSCLPDSKNLEKRFGQVYKNDPLQDIPFTNRHSWTNWKYTEYKIDFCHVPFEPLLIPAGQTVQSRSFCRPSWGP